MRLDAMRCVSINRSEAIGEATSGSVQSSAAPANEPNSRLAEQSECTERQETKLKTLCAVRIGAKRSDTAGHDTLAICRVTLNWNDYKELQWNGIEWKTLAEALCLCTTPCCHRSTVRSARIRYLGIWSAGRPASEQQTDKKWMALAATAHRSSQATVLYSGMHTRIQYIGSRRMHRADADAESTTSECSRRNAIVRYKRN